MKISTERRRIKRRQERVSHKKLRMLRSRKYARKTAKKVMRGGLLLGTDKKINVKTGGLVVNEAFILSFRKGIIKRNTLDLELNIDLTKFRGKISLLFNELLRKLTNNPTYTLPSRYESAFFDIPNRNMWIGNNQNTINSAQQIVTNDRYQFQGIYRNDDGDVQSLIKNSEWGKVYDREIKVEKISEEINKLRSIKVSKVSFSITIENGNIKITDVKLSSFFCTNVVIRRELPNSGYGRTQTIKDGFCKYISDLELTEENGLRPIIEIKGQEGVTIDTILSGLREITELELELQGIKQ